MKLAILALAVAFFVTGCSNTWNGVKDDSSKAYHETKQAIHEATADDEATTPNNNAPANNNAPVDNNDAPVNN
ncbi:hypothetical protein [Vibrio palustris]|uniref:Lipoprotein n=1 Tax=Vibrio palustris TaxID=1918946 RepID=A0A1R4B5K9_9VIBR|nr:hypothetical protein [Vibrio palustris]SJL84193.1 hypothetical protein VPAL9027_02175 [Vibrio palustris]